MLWLQPHPKKYYGQVFSVSWDAALALRDAGTQFPLLIIDHSAVSKQLEHALLNFVRSHNLPMYIAKVSLVSHPEAAQHLGVALVPQLRYYHSGEEVGRQTGTASYDDLSLLFGLSR
jgi:hypothetical protein